MKRWNKLLALAVASSIIFSGLGAINAQAATLKEAFNAKLYSDTYGDLKAAFGTNETALYRHYMNYGLNEGRDMSELINVKKYREAYADLDAAYGNNWNAYVKHYLKYGAYEGRNSFGTFDAFAYADRYPDLKAAYGYDVEALWKHYVKYGRAEGRDATRPVVATRSSSSSSSTPSSPSTPSTPEQPTYQTTSFHLVDPETGAVIPNATIHFQRLDAAEGVSLLSETNRTVTGGDAGDTEETVTGGDQPSQEPQEPQLQPTIPDGTFEVTGDEEGNYDLSGLADGNYRIFVDAEGYLVLVINNVIVNNGYASVAPTIQLLSETSTGVNAITGQLTNALNGQGIEGATVEIREGWGNYDDAVTATVTTDASGNYSCELPRGYYTVTFTCDGFVTKSMNAVSYGLSALQSEALTPAVAADSYRVVLTWGETPRDLDSHITGPASEDSYFHVYYSNKVFYNDEGEEVVTLDHDDITSYGPETVTIITPEDNAVYRYSVYNYSGEADIRTSNAVVTLYAGSEQVAQYFVPSNGAEGRTWVVFEIRDGVIVPINTIDNDGYTSTFSPDLYTE